MKIFDLYHKLLQDGLPVGSGIQAIQVALKMLGYMPNNYRRQIDSKWGESTIRAVKAFNWEVSKLADSPIVDYNEMSKLLKDSNYFKVPIVENPDEENQKVVELLEAKRDFIIKTHNIPYDFLRALLWQETGLRHYDPDGFVFVGCDFGKVGEEYKYRSRGYGLGQYTIKNHPPTEAQQENIIDPINNLEFVIRHLQEKFSLYCGKLKRCQYEKVDEKYLNDCKRCVELAPQCDIKLPEANWHYKAQVGYKDIPMLDVCGWGLAVERYNGIKQNAVAYRCEVVMKILGKEIR